MFKAQVSHDYSLLVCCSWRDWKGRCCKLHCKVRIFVCRCCSRLSRLAACPGLQSAPNRVCCSHFPHRHCHHAILWNALGLRTFCAWWVSNGHRLFVSFFYRADFDLQGPSSARKAWAESRNENMAIRLTSRKRPTTDSISLLSPWRFKLYESPLAMRFFMHHSSWSVSELQTIDLHFIEDDHVCVSDWASCHHIQSHETPSICWPFGEKDAISVWSPRDSKGRKKTLDT